MSDASNTPQSDDAQTPKDQDTLFTYDERPVGDGMDYVIYYPDGEALIRGWDRDEVAALVKVLNMFTRRHPIRTRDDWRVYIPRPEDSPQPDPTP